MFKHGLLLLFLTFQALAVERVQNEDVKSRATIISAGGAASQLIQSHKIYVPFTTKTSNAVLALTEEVVLGDTDSGNITFTLPAATNAGKVYRLKNVGTGVKVITIVPAGGDTADGDSLIQLTDPDAEVTIQADGVSDWEIL